MRLVVVSNRLPFTVVEKEGKLRFKASSGGLVSGLGAYIDKMRSLGHAAETLWVGWPGITVDKPELRAGLKAKALSDHSAYPVFLSEEAMDNFYFGFCNGTLWPLCHYFPTFAKYEEEYWEVYREVNQAFCDALLEIAQPGDIFWVHDYQLMLLPAMLRARMPEALIGFFFHIPFPSFEIFRLLPRTWREQLLEGLNGSDLVGFHTNDYTQNFLRSCLRNLGLEHNLGYLSQGERTWKADTFPMGIDFDKYHDAVGTPGVVKEADKLRRKMENVRTVFSVDRLDYSKGILNRLEGYAQFLADNPDWHRRVILIMVVVPSRTGVEQYQIMKRQVDEAVGRINGEYGDVHWTPVLYQYRSVSFDQLIALYSLSDVALLTPLRDGMNLVAKEYVAARADQTGVLILSEMAGAAKEMGEALIVNPNHKKEIAEAIRTALDMPVQEQVRNIQALQDRLRRYSVFRWAEDFVERLREVRARQKQMESRLLTQDKRQEMLEAFAKAKNPLLFLDCEGTLMPMPLDTKQVSPDEELVELLGSLASDGKSRVVLLSGRDKESVESWFGELPVDLVAEHGVWIRDQARAWSLILPMHAEWKSTLIPLLNAYVDRLPRSRLIEKEFSLAFHYRQSDPEQAFLRASELLDDLVGLTSNFGLQILEGYKVIEIHNAGVNKHAAAMHWLAEVNPDFVLGIGDDRTDEDLFRALPENGYSIKVGASKSFARFNLSQRDDVRKLLLHMVQANQVAGGVSLRV